jgi:hypothetical protein
MLQASAHHKVSNRLVTQQRVKYWEGTEPEYGQNQIFVHAKE